MENKVNELTKKYLAAFEAAGEGKGKLEDLLDKDGVEALRKILNAVPDLPNDLSKQVREKAAEKSTQNIPIPSVTRTDENGRTGGYDLFSLLLEDRIVMLLGEVNGSMSSVACASLLYLHNKDPEKDINIWVNSPGGSVLDGNAIIDTIETIQPKVIGTGFGFQASMGSHILAACDERRMTEKSKLLIHSISSRAEGNLADQVISVDMTERLFEDGKANYTRHIGLTPEYWDLCSVKNSVFSAEQALEMGFISGIVKGTSAKKAPYDASAKQYLFNEAARRKSQLPETEEELKSLLQATSANGSKGEHLRPEVLVALSKMPKYWVEEKQREFAQEHGVDLSHVKIDHRSKNTNTMQGAIARVLDKYIASQNAAAAANDNEGATRSTAKKKASNPPLKAA